MSSLVEEVPRGGNQFSGPGIPRCRWAAHQPSRTARLLVPSGLLAKLLGQSGTFTPGASSSEAQEPGTKIPSLVQAEEAFAGICPPHRK